MTAAALLACAVAAAAAGAARPAPPELPEDLGPAAIDVSDYPAERRRAYEEILLPVYRQRGTILPDGDGALVAHVHAASVGFGAMTAYGAGYRLLPWVGRERLAFPWAGRACFALTNAGLVGLIVDAPFLGHRLAQLWTGLLILGFVACAFSLRGVFSLSGRVDAPTATALLSFAGGARWCALGAGLALAGAASAWNLTGALASLLRARRAAAGA